MDRGRLLRTYEHLLSSDDPMQNAHPIRIEGDRVSWQEDPFIMFLVASGALDFQETLKRLKDYPERQRELARKLGYSLNVYERLTYVRALFGDSEGVPPSESPKKKRRRRRRRIT